MQSNELRSKSLANGFINSCIKYNTKDMIVMTKRSIRNWTSKSTTFKNQKLANVKIAVTRMTKYKP